VKCGAVEQEAAASPLSKAELSTLAPSEPLPAENGFSKRVEPGKMEAVTTETRRL